MTTDKELKEMIELTIFGFIILIFSECVAVYRYGTLSSFLDKNTELVLGLAMISLFTVVPCVICIVMTFIDAYETRKELSKKQ